MCAKKDNNCCNAYSVNDQAVTKLSDNIICFREFITMNIFYKMRAGTTEVFNFLLKQVDINVKLIVTCQLSRISGWNLPKNTNNSPSHISTGTL